MWGYRRTLAITALASGCGFTPSTASTATTNDGAMPTLDGTQQIDGAVTSGDGLLAQACVTVASIGVHLCPSNPPAGAIDVSSSTTLATDTGATTPPNSMLSCATMTAASTPDVCAIYATSITIDQAITLAATGPRPLVLIATQAIDIGGVLDVATHIGGTTGPGPVPAACGHNSSTPQGQTGAEGGSFGTKGASGGDDQDGDRPGQAGDAIGLGALTAGCPGATGGNAGGGGGGGGGAVLVAAPTVTIGSAGQIDASGAGASGASNGSRGGGGGGAGGLIAIQAPTLVPSGQIYANGGHGGGGSTGSQSGGDGTDPSGWSSGGGNGGANGNAGTGSVGSHDTTPAGNGGNGDNGDGGGGGGGGFGIIVIDSQSNVASANISPAPT